MEIEAKFALPEPEVGRRLQATNAIAGFTLSSNGIKHIHDVYLDTHEGSILAAGYACRYRVQDDGVLITIEPLQTADSAIHRREEIEAMIPVTQASGDMLKTVAEWPSPVRDCILPLIGDNSLVPLAQLNQTRLFRLVEQNSRLVAEMSLDAVCADTASRHLAFFELEVELMPQGTEDDLAKIAGVLQHEWKLLPERRSKFERVLAFLQGPPSSTGLLTERERQVCLEIAAYDRPEQRRAKALLALDGGATIEQAAECAGFSARRARHWDKLFRDKRLGIFRERLIEQMEIEPARPSPQVALVRVADALPTPVPPPRPGLVRQDSMAEAARKTIQFHFQRMLEQEAGTRAGEDIEELHDMRVATRRMRAACVVFDEYLDPAAWKPFVRLLRRTGRVLGRARDLDVFHEKMIQYLEQLPESGRMQLEPLLAAWQTEHDAAREELLAYLDSPVYAEFKAEFQDFLQVPDAGARPVVSKHNEPLPYRVPHVLPIVLYQGLAEVCSFDEWTAGTDAPLARYHQLRIASKRLRYTLEFFREVLCPEAEMLIAKIKALQDHLGNLQDAVVACEIVRNFLIWGTWRPGKGGRSFTRTEMVVAPGVAAYLAARQAEIQNLRNNFAPVWAEVRCEEFRRQLGGLVMAL